MKSRTKKKRRKFKLHDAGFAILSSVINVLTKNKSEKWIYFIFISNGKIYHLTQEHSGQRFKQKS